MIVAAAIVLAILAAGLLYQAIGLLHDRTRYAPIGRLVDIGGRRLHVYETGAGTPTVVLEAGIAASSLSWSLVQPRIAEFARVVSYDRAGLGWSDASDQPSTSSQLARDLHALLATAQIPPPYILVAHSYGGLVVRRFAADYPDLTAGLVLVDALHIPRNGTPLRTTNEPPWPAPHGSRAEARCSPASAWSAAALRCSLAASDSSRWSPRVSRAGVDRASRSALPWKLESSRALSGRTSPRTGQTRSHSSRWRAIWKACPQARLR